MFFAWSRIAVDQGFPTWGTWPPGVHFPIWRGTFKVGDWREKYIGILFISKYLYKD